MDTDRSGADNVSVLKLDTSFGHEEARDFSLPDYMPEIKRLLYVSATALPEGKFLNGNALELDGTLSYNAVYVGEDGTLVSAPLVTEYSADTALPFSPENTEGIAVDTEIENSACRATGPRSLNIRSRLRFRVMCDGKYENADLVTDAEGTAIGYPPSGIERLTEDVTSLVRRRGSVTESAVGQITSSEGARPVMCEGTLLVTSASAEGDSVKVSGKICVKCAFADEDGAVSGSECEIPFDVSVPVGSGVQFTDGRAWGRVASVKVTPDENGRFSVSVEYDLDAEAYCASAAKICTDAYSADAESENEYSECEIPSALMFGMKRFDLSGEAELKGDDAKIVFVAAPACQCAVTSADGKVAVSGTVRVRAVLDSDGEIFAREIEMPFKTELGDMPDGVSAQELQYSASCSAVDTRAVAERGKLSVDCDVCVSYSVCRRRKVRAVSAVKIGERRAEDAVPCIKVYYPEQDEDVWSICKKYRLDRAKLFKNNSFEDGKAPRGKPVIIL